MTLDDERDDRPAVPGAGRDPDEAGLLDPGSVEPSGPDGLPDDDALDDLPNPDDFDLPDLYANGLAAVIAANVRVEAARRGLHQHDLAAIVHKSRSSVSLRHRGKMPWTLDEIGLIAIAMGIDPAELVKFPQRPRPNPW